MRPAAMSWSWGGNPLRVLGVRTAPVYFNAAQLGTAAWQMVEVFATQPEVIGAELEAPRRSVP